MITGQINAMTQGALVWWDPQVADAARLANELEKIGLGEYAPKAQTAEAALQHAMADYGAELTKRTKGCKVSYMVQSRADKSQDGFELVEVNRKAGPNGYQSECACRVEPLNGWIEVLDGSIPLQECQERFNAYRKEATGAEVGRSLIALMEHLHGTCVRLGKGGNYYLPEDAVSTWQSVIDVFEGCGKTEVHCMRVVLDDKAAKSIRKGITAELLKEAAQVADDLRKGEISEGVLERRKTRSQLLRAKAREYEGILNSELSEVHAVLNMADSCAAAAVGCQESGSVFDDTFA